MDKGLLLNLFGRIANLVVAVDLCRNKNDVKGFDYYSKDFLTITKKDIEKAFEGFLPQLCVYMWEMIKEEQQRIKKWKAEEYSHFGVDQKFYQLMNMIKMLIIG